KAKKTGDAGAWRAVLPAVVTVRVVLTGAPLPFAAAVVAGAKLHAAYCGRLAHSNVTLLIKLPPTGDAAMLNVPACPAGTVALGAAGAVPEAGVTLNAATGGWFATMTVALDL